MSTTTSIRSAASVAGVTVLLTLSMAGQAAARPVPGPGGPDEQRCSVACYRGPEGGGAVDAPPPTVDENGIEVVQLGAGLLAGLALAGAGMTLAARRGHGHVERHA